MDIEKLKEIAMAVTIVCRREAIKSGQEIATERIDDYMYNYEFNEFVKDFTENINIILKEVREITDVLYATIEKTQITISFDHSWYFKKAYIRGKSMYCMEEFEHNGDVHFTIYQSDLNEHGEWNDWEDIKRLSDYKEALKYFAKLIGDFY